MKKKQINTFEEGLKTDLGSYQTSSKTLTWCMNMRRLSNGNDELVLQSEAGTVRVGELSPGFTPLAASSYNGVVYIASHNPQTGEGELGSFPSPGAQGLMEKKYRPLQNYCSTGNLLQPGNFRSRLFAFSTKAFLDMQLQPSYDGTINILLADGINPARLVNTRFSSPNGSTYTLVDRKGKDSNLYVPENFKTTLNLIQGSDRLLQTTFMGVSAGGNLAAGNYRFYFRYATADSNMTDVVAETGSVPVFFGDTIGTVRAGRPGERTDRRIQFNLRNLDPSYAFLEVYYTLEAGLESAATEVRHILNRYHINSQDMVLTVTGFEQSEVVSSDELNTTFASIASFRFLAQAQNRLFPAASTEKERAYELLEKFCKKVYLSHAVEYLRVPESMGALYNTPVLNTEDTVPVGGYANPLNVYRKTGYFGGEAYPFALAFVFPDGSLSPGIPVVGYDNVKGWMANSFSGSQRAAMVLASEKKGGFDPVTGVNTKGVYRFPNRRNIGAPLMENGVISIMGVRLEFPAFSDADYKLVRQETIGCVLLRGERKPDLLMQGFLVPSFNVLKAVSGTFTYHTDNEFGDPSKIKHLPAFMGRMECNRYFDADNKTHAGLNPVKIYSTVRGGYAVKVVPDDRYCLLSGDYMVDEAGLRGQLDSDATRQMVFVGSVRSLLAAPVTTRVTRNGQKDKTYTVAMCSAVIHDSQFTPAPLPVKTSWVEPDQPAFNQHGFSSQTDHLEFVITKDTFGGFDASYNSYAGIALQDNNKLNPETPLKLLQLGGGAISTSAELEGIANEVRPSAYLVNIYRGLEQITTAKLATQYDALEGLAYTPISDRLYWDNTYAQSEKASTVEGHLDSARTMTMFGGDCFIGMPLRRLYWNARKQSDGAGWDTNVGETVQLCHESRYNLMLRNTELNGAERIATGQARSFAPFLSGYANAILDDEKKNGIRMIRVPESGESNMGHHELRTHKLYSLLPQHMPYIAQKFDTRVYFSEPHINLAFSNGYRNIMRSAYKDYTRHLGAMTRLVTLGDSLYAVLEHGVLRLDVNERTAASVDSSVFLASPDVLTTKPVTVSAELGATWPGAVVVTDNHVYGIDVARAKIWRTEGGGLKNISDFHVQQQLRKAIAQIGGRTLEAGVCDVRAFYDAGRRDVYFVFFTKTGEFTTLVFNEELNQWECSFNFMPQLLLTSGASTYSFTEGLVMEHHQEQAAGNPNYSCFYGQEPYAAFEFVVRGEEQASQFIFDNLELVGNARYPYQISYANDEQAHTTLMIYDKGLILNNCKQVESAVRVVIGKVGRVRSRDKYLRVRVEYRTRERILLQYVNTLYRTSQI